jgi:hypothetical protein
MGDGESGGTAELGGEARTNSSGEYEVWGHAEGENTWDSLGNAEKNGEATTGGVREGWLRGEDSGVESEDQDPEGLEEEELFDNGNSGGLGEDVGGMPEESEGGQVEEERGGMLGGETSGQEEGDSGQSGGETHEENSGERVAWAATTEEDEIFGKRKGYPTDWRPNSFRREHSNAPADVIEAWFTETSIPIGESVKKDPEKMKRVKQLMYTWKDPFITETSKMVGTDLVVHSILTWENAIPVRAKVKRIPRGSASGWKPTSHNS